jgi:multicomponent Na+:H+ antiporter subunit B
VTRRVRMLLFGAAAAVVGAGLVWAVAGLPDFGHYAGPYGLVLEKVAVQQRHVTDIVSAVVFDYRGIDTLGEEMILFAAAVGCAILLRAQRGEGAAEGAAERAEEHSAAVPRPVKAFGAVLVAPTVVLGAYVVAHGHLTPGGGFQGGVIVAAAVVLVFVAGQRIARRREPSMTLLELAHSIGAAGFVLIGLGGLLGVAAMHNFLGYGVSGSLWSGGTIPVLNASVGIEVAGAIMLIVAEFLDQALLRSRQP